MTEETQAGRVFWRKGKQTMLCPLELTDAPVIYRGINNPDSYSFLLNTDPKGLGFEEDWIKSKQKPSDCERGSRFLNDEIQKYNSAMKNVADQHNLKFIDVFDVLDTASDLADGLHPNAQGYQKLFELIKTKVNL